MSRRMFGEPASGQTAVWLMTEVLCYLKHLRDAGTSSVTRTRPAPTATGWRAQRGGP